LYGNQIGVIKNGGILLCQDIGRNEE